MSGISPVGGLLRYWRRVRGLSRLGLTLEVSTTPRHVSFGESGRSQRSPHETRFLASDGRSAHGSAHMAYRAKSVTVQNWFLLDALDTADGATLGEMGALMPELSVAEL